MSIATPIVREGSHPIMRVGTCMRNQGGGWTVSGWWWMAPADGDVALAVDANGVCGWTYEELAAISVAARREYGA